MPVKLERLEKWLATALGMEDKGEVFYKKAAVKSKDENARQVFETLAADEAVHRERIKKVYVAITQGKDFPAAWKKMKVNSRGLTAIFRALAKKQEKVLKARATDLKAVEVGIQFEAESVKFYQAELKKAKGDAEKEFLQKMVEEETTHFRALKDMELYLTNPGAWFREAEHHGFDGA